jgi:hypothetical protein
MDESMIGLFIVAGVVIALVAIVIVLGVRYGSLRGAMFGARIARELGAIDSTRGPFSRGIKAKVFELEPGGEACVGLEVGAQGKRSYVTLDAASARKLAELLQNAARRG